MSRAAAYAGEPTEDGRFVPDSPGALRALLKSKAKAKKKIMIIIEDWRPVQSDAQRRMWFGIVVKRFCDETGYSFGNKHERDFVHHQVLIACGRYEVRKIFGKKVLEADSMKRGSMTAEEFSELFADAQRLGAEQEIIIPDPKSVEGLAMQAAYR